MNFKVITFGLLLPFLALSKAQSSDCMRFAKPTDRNCRCGWKNPTRIVGGSETGVNEYPMMAGLVDIEKRELYCGATIISSQWVLTAAHCVEGKNISTILLIVGEHDVTTGADTNATKLYRMEKCIMHPQYCIGGNKNDHDIAVCKTDPIEFNAKVGPVCLPFEHQYDSFIGACVTLLGWGLLDFGGAKSTKLQGVNVGVISSQQCANSYNYSQQIACSQMCTYAEGKDSCQMDSGGPVLWQSCFTKNMILVGITSAGVGCAGDIPTINTRVGYYINWITSVTPDAQYCRLE